MTLSVLQWCTAERYVSHYIARPSSRPPALILSGRGMVGAIIAVGPAGKRRYEMKKLTAAILTGTAMVVVPVAIAPVAHADVCAGAHGRHFAAGGCTNIAGTWRSVRP